MSRFPLPTALFDTVDQFDQANFTNVNNHLFANNDYKAAINFLKQYSGNQATFESYRREIERIIQWAWLIAEKSLLTLKRQDIEDYLAFCLKPPKSWIGLKRAPRFIEAEGQRVPNPEWRPFIATVAKNVFKKGITPDKQNYQLSQKAVQEIFTVLNSFYNYLLIEEKIPVNPIALIRQKSKYIQKRQHQAPVMRLTEKQWQYSLECTKKLAEEQPAKHERTLFIISALYLLYLRVSELVTSDRWTPQMRHFYQDSDGNWWFKTVGKGNKLRDIAVSDDMLTALKRYRRSLQLTALPSPNEQTPLLQKEKGQGGVTSTRLIRQLIQYCFDNAVEMLKKEGFEQEAEALEIATVHWLRHTGISDDINKRHRPTIHVRDDAGHSSSAITDRYNNAELAKRHQSARHKKL